MESTVFVLSGSDPGLGHEVCAELASRGASVVVHGESPSSASHAVEALRDVASGHFEPVAAERASVRAIRALASEVARRFSRSRGVVVLPTPERWSLHVTIDGLEETIAANFATPSLLARLLAPRLARGGRVVFAASTRHRAASELALDEDGAVKLFDPETVHQRAEVALAAAAMQLGARLAPQEVSVNTIELGLLHRSFTERSVGLPELWARAIETILSRSPRALAREIADAALDPRFAGTTGRCFVRGEPRAPAVLAKDPRAREAAWAIASSMVGLPAEERIAA